MARQCCSDLKKKVAGTGHYTEYKTVSYTMQRSFTSDFD